MGSVSPVSYTHLYSDGKRLGYSVKVNGQPVESELQDGYFTIERRWKKGDKVEVHFDMEPRVVKAHAKVEADRGRVAVERGPLVYCAEWPDNDFDIMSVLVDVYKRQGLPYLSKYRWHLFSAFLCNLSRFWRESANGFRVFIIPYRVSGTVCATLGCGMQQNVRQKAMAVRPVFML